MQTKNISHNRVRFAFEPAEPSVVAGPGHMTKPELAAIRKRSRLISLARFSRRMHKRTDEQTLASPEVPSEAIKSPDLMSTDLHEWALISGHEF